MANSDQVAFLTKLHKELQVSSSTYRKETMNIKSHIFTLTKKGVRSAVRKAIYDQLVEKKEIKNKGKVTQQARKGIDFKISDIRSMMQQLDPHINTFFEGVRADYEAKERVDENVYLPESHGLNTSDKITAIFKAYIGTSGNTLGKTVNRYDSGYRKVLDNGKLLVVEIMKVLKDKMGAERTMTSGFDLFNIEHEHYAGVLETAMRDTLNNTIEADSLQTEASVMAFFGSIGADLRVIRDTVTSSVSVFVGSAPENRAEGRHSEDRRRDLLKAVKEVLDKLQSDPTYNVADLEGSDSFRTIKQKEGVNSILKPFRKIKGAKVSIDEEIKHSKSDNTKENKRKVSIGKRKPSTPKATGARIRRSRSPASTQLQLVANLNKGLPARVKKNMNPPALQNRTGRFAESVKVTDVMQTPKGFPSVGYTYDRDNYEQFEATSGSKSYASHQRDPRKLIDKSIRELATTMAIGRFFTRRV